jgi:hypothetical protein
MSGLKLNVSTRLDPSKLQKAGVLEYWSQCGDEKHMILHVPIVTPCCGQPHAWLVNWDGRSRCIDCHLRYRPLREQQLAEFLALAGGAPGEKKTPRTLENILEEIRAGAKL